VARPRNRILDTIYLIGAAFLICVLLTPILPPDTHSLSRITVSVDRCFQLLFLACTDWQGKTIFS
jgi:hypothetical protein